MRKLLVGLLVVLTLSVGVTISGAYAEDRLAGDSQGSQTSDVAVAPQAALYYFHRTLRCDTCLRIEAYIDEALRIHFSDALSNGRLLWRPTNIDEPDNVHFQEEFDLEFNSAVLVRLADGETGAWQNLEAVWDLLDDKERFVDYVREHVTRALAPADEPE